MAEPAKAVFLSYAREDAEAARHIAEALRGFGVEVWFDQSELRGGDQWDQKIRGQIKACGLFIPVISATTQAREEAYFRLEWKLADDRSHLMASGKAFIVPVVIDDTPEAGATVPDSFGRSQWTRLPGALPTAEFVAQVKRLLEAPKKPALKTEHPKPASQPDFKPVAGVARGEHVESADPGRRAAEPGSATPATRKSLPGWTWGALTAVVVGVAVALSVSRKPEPAPAPAKVDPKPALVTLPVAPLNNKSLAVLPFENLSPDKDDAFFTSGIHEEILTAMQTLRDLRVIQFRGANKPIRQIGEELNVAFVLECSVRRSGNKVRVTGKLTHTRTEELAWAEKFEGDLTDVFAIQAQLAQAIAAKLSAVISPIEKSVLERRPTTNVAAYDLYLKAKDIKSRSYNTESATQRSETLLLSAVELDPQFALAWGELAFTHAFMYGPGIGHDRTEQRLAKAREALAKTQQLAPGAAETLRVEGNFYYFTVHDYPRAMALFKQVLALRPNDPESYLSLAQVQRREGKWAECAANYQRALALDPQDDRLLRNAANTLSFCRHYDEALALHRRRVNYEGDIYIPRLSVALLNFWARGSTDEGDREAKGWAPTDQSIWAQTKGDFKEVIRHDDPADKSSLLAIAIAWGLRGLGDEAAARQRVGGWTEKLQASLVTQPTSADLWMRLAQVHSLAGRHEEALACGRKAVEQLPESIDAWQGARKSADLAWLEAWAGHTDRALSEYARLLRNGGANVHVLRAEALPAALKQDPRFQALLNDPKNNAPIF